MMQTISEEDYNNEVQKQAHYLRNAVEDSPDDTPLYLLREVLDGHSWFVGEELSGADYGAIIADFSHYNGEFYEIGDPQTLTDGDDFITTLRRMAFGQFEADVYNAFQDEDFE